MTQSGPMVDRSEGTVGAKVSSRVNTQDVLHQLAGSACQRYGSVIRWVLPVYLLEDWCDHASFHGFGSWPDSSDWLISDVTTGVILSASSVSSLDGTSSGPAALPGFRFLRSFFTPDSVIMS